jgi:hypothetical protein
MGRATEIDNARVNASGTRIVRGLYFIETGQPLPKGALLKVGCTMQLIPTDPEMQTIARTIYLLPERRDRAFGDAFSYVASFGDGMSFWLMLLYDYVYWLATIDLREVPKHHLLVS